MTGQESSNAVNGWDKAIYDTEQKIAATKSRLSRLKAALALFKEQKSAGEPFPGESAETSEADHSTSEAKPTGQELNFKITADTDQLRGMKELPTKAENGEGKVEDADLEIMRLFHELWSDQVRMPGYDKEKWMRLQRLLSQRGVTVE